MISFTSWEIKKYLRLSLSVLLAMLGLIILGLLGFDIPILRQIVGFIFLSFIPGFLILRILKIHNITAVESLLYSVGLSIAFIYFIGLFNNFALPLIGISKPISTLPVIITSSIFTLILGIIAYKRDQDFLPSSLGKPFNLKKYFSPPYLLLILLPILAILGTELVNVHQDNRILLALLALIACVVALAALNKIPENAYPLVIAMIAISLLFHLSLISPTLFGSDIQSEYYFQHIVLQNGYWDSTIPGNLNTCLSITMLCPIYSLILNIDGVWIYKIIYPLFFSLVPLALFVIFKEQIGAKKAFLAAFFFMAIPSVVPLLISHARQEIAEIFFVLLILLMVDKKLTPLPKSFLAIAFAVSLPLSHYGLTYISIAIFGIGWLLFLLIKNPKISHLYQRFSHGFSPIVANLGSNSSTSEASRHSPLNGVLICLLIVFTFAWYMFTTGGSAFNTIVSVGNQIYVGLSDFFEPTVTEGMAKAGLGLGFFQANSLSKIYRVLQYFTEIFIVIGFLGILLKPKIFKFRQEFIAQTIVAALILFASIVVPYFGTNLGFERFYHISSFFLAPFCILGGEIIWQGVSKSFNFLISLKFLKMPRVDISNCSLFLILAILIPYFLFTSSFVSAFTGQPASIALGPYKMDWYTLVNQYEVDAATWVTENLPDDSTVYADATGSLLLSQQLYGQVYRIPSSGEVPDNAYIFLRTWNIKYQEILVPAYQGVDHVYVPVNLMNRPELANRLENSSIIYDNGSARFLAPIP